MKAFLILAAYLSSAFTQCPSSSWTLHPGGRRCFLAHNLSYPYAAAKSHCYNAYSHSGFLATVNDSNDTMACLAATKWGSSNQFWFGLQLQQKTTYIWNEGKVWSGYKNWKTGSGPVLDLKTDCIAFEGSSGKWISGNNCTKLLPFICEVPAMLPCKFEKLQLARNGYLRLETDGASSFKTVKNYNCTKEISVAPDVERNQNLHIRIKAKMTGAPYSDIVVRDGITGKKIPVSGSPGLWHDHEYNTYTRKIRLEAFAQFEYEVGYSILITMRSGQCPTSPEGPFILFDNGNRCYSSWAYSANYTNAQAYCGNYGGYLATVRSSDDYPALSRASNGYSTHINTWIGLHKNATTKSYVWDDGSKVGYTNWKTGPTSAVSDCVAHEYLTSKWLTGIPCDTINYFVCETKAVRVIPYIQYYVAPYREVFMTVSGFPTGTAAYNRSFEVSVLNEATETVLLKLKYYVKIIKTVIWPTGVWISDVNTGEKLKYFGSTNGQWVYIEYDTKRAAVRFELFADIMDELAVELSLVGKPI